MLIQLSNKAVGIQKIAVRNKQNATLCTSRKLDCVAGEVTIQSNNCPKISRENNYSLEDETKIAISPIGKFLIALILLFPCNAWNRSMNAVRK